MGPSIYIETPKKICGKKANVKFFTVDPYLGCMFFWDSQKEMKIAHFGIFRHIGGPGGPEKIWTPKYSGSSVIVSKTADVGLSGALQ